MTKKTPITADKFFSWSWGFYIAVFISVIVLVEITYSKGGDLKAHQYAADFYSILRGERSEAIYDPDAEGFAHFLRTLKKDQATSTLLDISLGYAVAFHSVPGENPSYGRSKALDGAKALISRLNLDKDLFSDMQSYLEHKNFGKIVKNPQGRKKLKQLLTGEKIEPITVDLTPYSPWKLIGILLLISQLALGVTYFIGYAVARAEPNRWWYLSWSLSWPYLAIPLWFPGALPLVAIASLVSAIIHRRKRAPTRKVTLVRENNLGSLPEFDASLTEGQELLSRLKERVRR